MPHGHVFVRHLSSLRDKAYLTDMKRILTALVLVFAPLSVTLAHAQEAIPLARISDYLNGLTTAQSTFTQYNEDGSRSTGTLYVKRPGRMRFEYDAPNSGIVIAGGSPVIIHDRKSNQPPETYPLKRTPLSIILARRVDLGRANMVVGHSSEGALTVVRAQDPENPEYGHIDLKFSDSPVRLVQWIVTNEHGSRTAVALDGLKTGMSLSDNMFNTQTPRGGANR